MGAMACYGRGFRRETLGERETEPKKAESERAIALESKQIGEGTLDRNEGRDSLER